MVDKKVTLVVTVSEVEDGEAVKVAKELFEVFWNSKFSLDMKDLSIDGKSAYKSVMEMYAKADENNP